MALRHPRSPLPSSFSSISAGEKQRRRLCTSTAAGLEACLGLIVKFFVPHSGPFYRLVPLEEEEGEAEGVADL